MQWLKQSTAITVKIGPFLDSTDGVTAETALTITAAEVLLSKNGGAFTLKNEATACTHDTGGWYGCPINATDTNTLGRLQLSVQEAGALPVWHEFMVVPANVWDSFFGADYLKSDVTQAGGSAIQQAGGYFKVKDDEGNTLANEAKQDTIDTVVDGIQTDLDNATDGLGALKALIDTLDTVADAIKVVTDSLTDLATLVDAVWDEDVDTSHQTAGTSGKKLDDAGAAADPWATAIPGAYGAGTAGKIVGDNVNAPIATVDTVADAIKAVTDNLPNSGALTAITGYVDILDHATNGLANIKSLIDTLDTVVDAIKAKTDNQPAGIPKGVEFTLVFLMKLSSDHVLPAIGKTLTTQISKDGGSFTGTSNSASEIGFGFYKIVLTATEMNAAIIGFKATETDCDLTSATITTSA